MNANHAIIFKQSDLKDEPVITNGNEGKGESVVLHGVDGDNEEVLGCFSKHNSINAINTSTHELLKGRRWQDILKQLFNEWYHW